MVVTILMLFQNFLGTVVLLVYHLQHLIVHNLGGCFRVGTLELILLVVVIAQVGQTVAHAGIGHHAVSTLCGTLQVVHGSGGYVSGEELLCSASSQERAHLVKHLLLGGDGPFFWQIPCCAECLTAGHDAHFYQWIGVFAEP